MPPVVARVAGIGMACPVGLRSRPAIAAMNAGITRFFERDDVVGPGGPARASMLMERPLPLLRAERAAFFARHAVAEALSVPVDASRHPLTCVLALPGSEVGPRIDPGVLMRALDGIPTGAGTPARLVLHRAVEEGRAGFFLALEAAIALLALGRERLVLVVGVDSCVDTQTLTALAERNRIGSRANLDGIIPGEGAGCVLLGHPSAVSRQQTLALLPANAVAREPVPFAAGGSKTSTAEGLAAVFRTLWLDTRARADEVFAGTTGEVFFGREFAHAYLRNAALMPEPLRQRGLGAALGDVGAAAGAICTVHAIVRLGPAGPGNRGTPNRSSLAYASSDHGLVGGCVVAAPG